MAFVSVKIPVVWTLNYSRTVYRSVIWAILQMGGGNPTALVSQNAFIAQHAPRYPEGFLNSFTLNSMAAARRTALFSGSTAANKQNEQDLGMTTFLYPRGNWTIRVTTTQIFCIPFD